MSSCSLIRALAGKVNHGRYDVVNNFVVLCQYILFLSS